MSIFVLSFLISAGYVSMKSIQQLNVQNKIYWLIPPVSVIMALLEIFVVHTITKNVADDLFALALSLGLGGGFGSCAAVYLHDKIITKDKQ